MNQFNNKFDDRVERVSSARSFSLRRVPLSRLATWSCLVMTLVTLVLPKFVSAQEVTSEQVAKSIRSATQYLMNKQSRTTGRWTPDPKHRGGVTALVTLSMLLSGVDSQHATIKRSLRYLDSLDIDDDRLSVYTVSLLAMVYCEAEPVEYQARIRRCVNYLTDAQIKDGSGQGGWSYTRAGGPPDGSNTQFAILALSEAAKLGITVEQAVWQRALWYWEGMYKGDGRFIYRDDNYHRNVATGSMICAAIASLIIIDDNLSKRPPLQNGEIVCCGDDEGLPMVDAANEWLEARFTVRHNPTQGTSLFKDNRYYFLYSMERAARLSGQRFFGKYDWYREGARALVALQRGDGRWETRLGHGETNPHVATSLALLFLSKGRRPIVIGKYQHGDDSDWDRHRKGVHYLMQGLEKLWRKKLSWQTINGRVATSSDLLEAPVLFISGRDSLRLNADQKKALKEYIEYGGFIFAEACQGDGCGDNVGFDRDFQALMLELFPESRLQLLDGSHPVFNAQFELPVNTDRCPVYGLQSSCRTSVIYVPKNMSGYWRFNRPSFMVMLPEAPRRDVVYTTQLGLNVIAYATGRELKDKLDRPQVVEASEVGLGERIVFIPKLAHSGGSDDAPNAWQNILRRASFDLKERFKIEREMIQPNIEALQKYPMVFTHGRRPFKWTEEQRTDLRKYFTESSGFLFADSICSSNGFVESFRAEMKALFPEYELQKIPSNDRIYSDRDGGYDLQQIGMHQPDPDAQGGVRRFRSEPQLEGIQIDGRWVVVFSPHDLSCAMENGVAAQCPGYDKDDAARLGVNIILYRLKN